MAVSHSFRKEIFLAFSHENKVTKGNLNIHSLNTICPFIKYNYGIG